MIVDNVMFIIEQVSGLVDVPEHNAAFLSRVSCPVFVVTTAVCIFARHLDRAAVVGNVAHAVQAHQAWRSRPGQPAYQPIRLHEGGHRGTART
jgi:hypothetical protein